MRHRPSRFGVALFDSIHYVPADAWAKVVPESRLFMRPVYLSALESSGSTDLRHRYALLYDGRQPVAAVAMQIHQFSGESLGSRQKRDPAETRASLRGKVGAALRKATDRVTLRVLICGNAFVTGEHGFCHVPGIEPVDAFVGLADVVYRVRRADKLHGQVAGVLIKDFYVSPSEASSAASSDTSNQGAQQLTRFGYREFSVDPQMVVVLRPEWQSFDDYVAAMNAKYRSRVRGARRKGANLHKRRFAVDEIVDRHTEIRRLFAAVHEKASFRIADLPADYFPALAEALGSDFGMHGYFLDDQLVGFTTSIRWGGQRSILEGHYLGLDYEFNVEHAIYQNILYDDVSEALERGCSELLLGRTALAIKSAIGAVPRPVTCYVRHRNPASNAVVKPFFGFVKPTTWTQRNPFKGAE